MTRVFPLPTPKETMRFIAITFILTSLLHFHCHGTTFAQQSENLLEEVESFIDLVEKKISTLPELEQSGDLAVHGLVDKNPTIFGWKHKCSPKNILRQHIHNLIQHRAETLEAANPLRLAECWVEGTKDSELSDAFEELRQAFSMFYIALHSDPAVQSECAQQRQLAAIAAEERLIETRQRASVDIAEAESKKNTALVEQQEIIAQLTALEEKRSHGLLQQEEKYGNQRRMTAHIEQEAYKAKTEAHTQEEKVARLLLEREGLKAASIKGSESHQRMLPLLVGGSALAVIFGYFFSKRYFKWRPTIIESTDTSLLSWWEKLLGRRVPPSNLDAVILEPLLAHQVLDKFTGMASAIQEGYPLSNMLFCGLPGTGKTMTAQAFARKLYEENIADHVIVRGAAFKRLNSPAKAQSALADTLRLAQENQRPVILVFDEAETLFPARDSSYATEMTNDLTTTLLSFFENAIDLRVMFILSTNYPERIDDALLNRVDPSNYIYFTKPTKRERLLLLTAYLKQEITDRGLGISDEILHQKENLAESLDGFVGRQIRSLIVQTLYTMARYQTKQLELFMLHEAVASAQKNSVLIAG